MSDAEPPDDQSSDQSDRRGELAGLAAAFGAVARGIRSVARTIPGVGLIESQASAGERLIVRQIRRRLDQVDGPPLTRGHSRPALSAPPAGVVNPQGDGFPPTVEEMMTALLTRSVHDSPTESRRTLHEVLVSELVPDEARILAALSDGSSYPLVHIAAPGVGTYQKLVLENASSVGRAAGVALPDRVHLYVSHLRRLGLVDIGPEDHSLKDEYEILLTEPNLRAVIASIGKGPRGARIIRRTVRMSDLGRELWGAARPPRDVAVDQGDPSAG
jgi:Abortive infection alpha